MPQRLTLLWGIRTDMAADVPSLPTSLSAAAGLDAAALSVPAPAAATQGAGR